MIEQLDEQIGELDAQIKSCINNDDELKGKRDLIESIIGVGPQTSSTLLGETAHIEEFRSAKRSAVRWSQPPRAAIRQINFEYPHDEYRQSSN